MTYENYLHKIAQDAAEAAIAEEIARTKKPNYEKRRRVVARILAALGGAAIGSRLGASTGGSSKGGAIVGSLAGAGIGYGLNAARENFLGSDPLSGVPKANIY